MAIQKQHFTVSGMKGSSCEQKVNQAIHALDPQAQVTVNASQGIVDVQSGQSRQQLEQAIEKAGYSVQT